MLRDLAGGTRTVSELAEPFDLSLAAASKHIKALENAGLLRREVRGRTHLCAAWRRVPWPAAPARSHAHLGVLVARVRGERPEPFWDSWSRLNKDYARRIPA